MNEDKFKERVAKIQEINAIIDKLDASIRSQAFELLMPYITGRKDDESPNELADRGASDSEDESGAGDVDEAAESFFNKFNHDRPSDNALLVSAYLYSRFGTTAFSLEDVREIADTVGLTIPDRVDMTFVAAKREGKALFRRAGKGAFKPTVYGETHLKATYDVKKGRARKESATE